MKAAHTRRELVYSSPNGYLAACIGIGMLLVAAYLFKTGLQAPGSLTVIISALGVKKMAQMNASLSGIETVFVPTSQMPSGIRIKSPSRMNEIRNEVDG